MKGLYLDRTNAVQPTKPCARGSETSLRKRRFDPHFRHGRCRAQGPRIRRARRRLPRGSVAGHPPPAQGVARGHSLAGAPQSGRHMALWTFFLRFAPELSANPVGASVATRSRGRRVPRVPPKSAGAPVSRLSSAVLRTLTALPALVALLAAPRAMAQDACNDPSGPSCCTPHNGPGCADWGCCRMTCLADPFCCDVRWDQLCASAANAQCGNCWAAATVSDLGCGGLQLSFAPVPSAVSHAVFMERQTGCNSCPPVYPGQPGYVAATVETIPYPGAFFMGPDYVVVPRSPAFLGRWRVVV